MTTNGIVLEYGLSVVIVASLGAGPSDLFALDHVESKVICAARNPEPQSLPSLEVRQEDKLILVSATFPKVPDFTCDSWCYESAVDFIGARSLDGGRLELRHRVRDQRRVVLTTVVTPEPDAVEFAARAGVDPQIGGNLPDALLVPNLCWQLRRAKDFASKPDPYPEFVKRCFIFTDQGRTFLDRTVRKKIPCRAADDRYNNPPWVQMYVGRWQEIPKVGPTSWADYSSDRYVATVIGTVSRDGTYLAALANDSAPMMAQAWHDCMHNNPLWLPAGAPPAAQSWRLKFYVMKNDPEALLKRVRRDFPAAVHSAPQEGRSSLWAPASFRPDH